MPLLVEHRVFPPDRERRSSNARTHRDTNRDTDRDTNSDTYRDTNKDTYSNGSAHKCQSEQAEERWRRWKAEEEAEERWRRRKAEEEAEEEAEERTGTRRGCIAWQAAREATSTWPMAPARGHGNTAKWGYQKVT